MPAFTWGKILEIFEYDFDGKTVEVVKYLPHKFVDGQRVRGEYEDAPLFHIEELREAAATLDAILISWIARQRLGLNQHALVAGICRALDIS